jgi:serine phosphatase RsbU (regulator of sigma subunit)/CHASE2 domain-containing sensor protein
VKAPAAEAPRSARHVRITLIGLVLLAALSALAWWGPRFDDRLQSAWFDSYQRLRPRELASTHVAVVEIDEASLARFGQWPWPRTRLAELIDGIARCDPAAIGIDILMPEADRLSPERLLDELRSRDAVLASRLDALPSNDRTLAQAIAAAPVVLPVAATPDAGPEEPTAPPFLVIDRAREDRPHGEVAGDIPRFGGARLNVPELERAAAGHGAISAEPGETVVRRLPLVVRIGERLVPSLATEMLRVALGAPDVRLYARGPRVETIAVGDLVVPTEADGQMRLWYSHRDPRRQVSAIRVLDGTVDPEALQRKLVIVTVTGLALVDYQLTPLGERMPGAEVHAQLLENLVEQSWLTRPAWAPAAELAMLVLAGLALVWATPRWRPGASALLMLASVALVLAAGIALFVTARVVLDAATPSLALAGLYGALLVPTLSEAARQRRALERTIQQQREQAAYVAGELEAAKRIQLGFLPKPEALADPRVEIAASMTPAREVGGDLYDFFALDRDRLFFLVGDVSGKGLSASLFMAVGKALCKSITLRNKQATIGDLMCAANEELSRDNPELLFVTAFAGILDLQSGALEYCNAGHDDPYLLRGGSTGETRVGGGGGPPLCTLDAFPYAGDERRLAPGDVLCVVTDGVVDAENTDAERYGSARLRALLARQARDLSARRLVDAIREEVAAFAAGAEPADDVTILALRWNGPPPASGGRP